MCELLHFISRQDFRRWLSEHCHSGTGVWLLLAKAGGPNTISASDALKEALCFGWIDGQMQRIDDKRYKKYFAERRNNSKWSAKNRALAQKLQKQGLMAPSGLEKIQLAQQNGQWSAPPPPPVTGEQVGTLSSLLQAYQPAYTNFLAMSPSVQKTYARAYFSAKTASGRARRLSWMVDRLNKNLKPM